MIIDCVSDMHGSFPELVGGDLLILAGDHLANHNPVQQRNFHYWLDHVAAPAYEFTIFIGGNHDKWLEDKDLQRSNNPTGNIGYLFDDGVEFFSKKIHGSPWTRWFEGVNPMCASFMLMTESQLKEKWDLIPDDTEILVTHSPPHLLMDKATRGSRGSMGHCGSVSLAERVKQLKNLKLHVFGHIHEAYGQQIDQETGLISVNAAHMTRDYEPTNAPIRISL